MADIIPLTMGTRDIQATDGEAITAVEVAECSAVACSVEVYLEKAMAAVDRTGAVAIIDSVKDGPPLVRDRPGV